jgi:hypothetical protein
MITKDIFVNIKVWPSAGAWVKRLSPTKPPAPVVFSTITVCFRSTVIVLAKSLAKVSSVPPGATPTIMVIDFDGKLCANAGFENSSAANVKNNVRIMICLRVICLLLKNLTVHQNDGL